MIERLDGTFPLALTPGFHALERTVFDGTLERGGIILRIFCTCAPNEAIARIEARLTKSPSAFRYWATARNEIQIEPALDVRTDAGHFVTDDPWTTQPEGLSFPDEHFAKAQRTRVKPKAQVAQATPPSPVTLERIRAAEQGCPRGVCAHELGFHDERLCSKCNGPCAPGKAKRARAK